MVIYLLGNGQPSFVEPRLAKLGIRVQHFTKDSIRDLNHDTVDLVYLLPFKTLLDSDWPRLRVRLAQANRCYIVVSSNLSSAEIMNAARDGAYDVLLSADGEERWLEALRKVVDSQKLWLQLYGGAPMGSKDLLVGQSEAVSQEPLRPQNVVDAAGQTAIVTAVGKPALKIAVYPDEHRIQFRMSNTGHRFCLHARRAFKL